MKTYSILLALLLPGCTLLLDLEDAPPGDPSFDADSLAPDASLAPDGGLPDAALPTETCDFNDPTCSSGTCYWSGTPGEGRCYSQSGDGVVQAACTEWNACEPGLACVNLLEGSPGYCYELCDTTSDCTIGDCTGVVEEIGKNFCVPF